MVRVPRHTRAASRGGIGGNYPPEDVNDGSDYLPLADAGQIRDTLSRQCAELERRRDELLAGIERWKEAHAAPDGGSLVIADRQDCANTIDFIKQLKLYRTHEVEPERKRCKVPFDEMCDAVQGYFVGLQSTVENATAPIQTAYEHYLKAEEVELRRDMRCAAAEKAQEAQRLTAQAQRATDQRQQESLYHQAKEAQDQADALFDAAENASAADLTKIRGDLGAIGGLKVVWEWEVESLMDLVQAVAQGREPIDMLRVNDTVINAMVRKGARQKIAGLRIHPVRKGR